MEQEDFASECLQKLMEGQQRLQDQLADVIQGQHMAAIMMTDIQRSMGEPQQVRGRVPSDAESRPQRSTDVHSVAPPEDPATPETASGRPSARMQRASVQSLRRTSIQSMVPIAAVRTELVGRRPGRAHMELDEGSIISVGRRPPDAQRRLSDGPAPARSDSCMLDPTSYVRVIFDLLSLAVLCYDMLATPYILAWGLPFEGLIKYATYLTTCFWLLDVAVHFRTGLFVGGDLEMRPRQVARHYFRTTFWLDISLVCVDVLTLVLHMVNWDVSTNSVKLARIAKITRFFRITGVVRVVHFIEMGDHPKLKRLTQGAGIMAEIFRILTFIMYLNHVIACAWWWLGSYAPSDTDHHWIDESIFSASDKAYGDTVPGYQYLTSIHWTLSQMTPGSMQVVPVNSYERMFNVACLLCGLITFSSLISMLSSKMTNFRIQRQGQVRMIAELDQFLQKAQITSPLVIKIHRQVRRRLAQQRELNLNDVQALKHISASTRAELRVEYYQHQLFSHPLFRVFAEACDRMVRKLCLHAVEAAYMQTEDTLFEAGVEARTAYVTVRGSLEYTQDPLVSPVAERAVTRVSRGQWICEAAIWCTWTTVGQADVSSPCELLVIQAAECAGILAGEPVCHEVAKEYAILFNACLDSARNPESAFPSDLHVPGAEFDEIVLAAPQRVQTFLGLASVEILKRQQWLGNWGRHWRVDRLAQEVREGKSNLIVTKMGEICRVTVVVAISITDGLGRVFAQIGKTHKGIRVPACRLPGTKIREGEVLSDAVHRVLEGELKPFAHGLLFDSVEKTIEERPSDTYGVKTRYIRQIQFATLEDGFDLSDVVMVKPRDGAAPAGDARGCCAKRSRMHALSLNALPTEVSVLADGPEVFVGAWLFRNEFQHLGSPASRQGLQDFLDSLDLATAMLDAGVGQQDGMMRRSL